MPATDVFISSTCYDLADLRAELRESLSIHAFLVRMSEDYESEFVVNPRLDSIGSCLENVEKANVVVCILDRRYGPVLPSAHEYSGISATHAELQYADRFGKPTFNFVRKATFVEAEKLVSGSADEPRWIEKKTKMELARLVMDRRSLASANKNTGSTSSRRAWISALAC